MPIGKPEAFSSRVSVLPLVRGRFAAWWKQRHATSPDPSLPHGLENKPPDHIGDAAWPTCQFAGLALTPARLFLLYAAAALAYRMPAVLYFDLNWDESLYRLIGNSLVSGHAPYTEFWDRKPVGIFMIMAAIQIAFGKSLLALRTVTSIVVAFSAYLLAMNSRSIIPNLPLTGIVAGFLYIIYSTHNGGEGTNTELFYTPAGLAGLLLAFKAARSPLTRALVLGLAAGLLMGVAVQIKQVAIFDILAYAAIYLVTQVNDLSRSNLAHHSRIAIAAAAGILLPTLFVIVWYTVIGRLDAFYGANFAANIDLIEDYAPKFNIPGLDVGLRGFSVLIAGTVLTLVIGPFLANTRELRRGLLAIFLWLAAMAISLLFLRRFADHFFLQMLPSVAFATAFGMVLAAEAAAPARLVPAGVLLCTALIAAWGGAPQFNAGAEVLWRRYVDGVAHWGDKTATIGQAIRGRTQHPDDVYVFGRLLGVYEVTGTTPPTRFPFSEHLFSEYAAVDGETELNRILGNSPRFIVCDDNWLNAMPATDARTASVFGALHQALSQNYVIDGHVGAFRSWGGGTVGTRVGATVFRLRGTPGIRPTPGLQYDAAP